MENNLNLALNAGSSATPENAEALQKKIICLEEEKQSIDALAETYKSSNALLKKIVEKEDVNEEYIFDILESAPATPTTAETFLFP